MREKRQPLRSGPFVVIVLEHVRLEPSKSYWRAKTYISGAIPEEARSSSPLGALERLAGRLGWT